MLQNLGPNLYNRKHLTMKTTVLFLALVILSACGDARPERREAITKQNAEFTWEVDKVGADLMRSKN